MTSPLDTIKGAILGVPFDPNKKPSRQGTVQAFAEMQVQLEGAQAGSLVKDTLANLNALASVSEASIMAWVTNDPTQANNGIYENTGTDIAPVWTRRIDIPQFVISGVNVGAGTADAIQATTDLPLPIQDGRTLIIVNIVADNTGAMTLSLNSGAALPILTVSGDAIPAATLTNGMHVAGFISSGNFYLITDVASAAIVAAAAASAAAALSSENNAATSESNAADSAAAADVAKIEWQGAWVTTTVYNLNDAVEEAGSSYICIVAHTAGVFATDLGAGKWELLAQKGVGDLVASNNLSDIANAITAFSNIKQNATESVTGVLKIATQTKAEAGTDDVDAMTALKVKQAIAALGGKAELAASWVYSAGVAEVEFIDMGEWDELTVISVGLNTASATSVLGYLSDDNGTTYYNTSGDYTNHFLTHSTSSSMNAAAELMTLKGGDTTLFNSRTTITGFNSASAPTSASNAFGAGGTNEMYLTTVFQDDIVACNAIKFVTGTGDIIAGAIYIIGRR